MFGALHLFPCLDWWGWMVSLLVLQEKQEDLATTYYLRQCFSTFSYLWCTYRSVFWLYGTAHGKFSVHRSTSAEKH